MAKHKLLRMDNVGIIVEDLEAAVDFFVELGLELEGKMAVEGDWVDRIVALDGVLNDVAMMHTPDGHGKLELIKYQKPKAFAGEQNAPVNALGIRRIMFAVKGIDDVVARLQKHGARLIGEMVQYGDSYKLCYLHGPEGIMIALAEELTNNPEKDANTSALLRMDNVLIVVDDLEAVKGFFLELGLELEGEPVVEGPSVDSLLGLKNVKATLSVLRTPDGHSGIELDKFHSPGAVAGDANAVNTIGIRRLMFAVENIDDVVARLQKQGAQLMGEVVTYENAYKLCYLRGPEGIIIALAEALSDNAEKVIGR